MSKNCHYRPGCLQCGESLTGDSDEFCWGCMKHVPEKCEEIKKEMRENERTISC